MLGENASMLVCDRRWREMHFGAWEGLTREQIVARNPSAKASAAPRFMTPEGGETFEKLCARVTLALEDVAAETPSGGRALVATHAGALHAALRVLIGEREATELGATFSPASFTSFAIERGRARVIALNRTPWESAAAGTGRGGG